MSSDGLERFVAAQEPVIERVLAELRAGRKTSHWMWFVFPQIQGLGRSPTAQRFAISSRAEAEAYLRHEVLGPRLRECTRLVNAAGGRSVEEIFGYPDDLKFHSSMTLFAHATADNQVFRDALREYFGGQDDPQTLERLSGGPGNTPSHDRSIDETYGLEPVFEPGAVAGGTSAADGVQLERVECPYCGECFETQVDVSAGASSYVEDCQVCCQPIQFTLEVDDAGALSALTLRRGDD